MSTGNIKFFNRLVESDFPELIDNINGTSVIMGIMEDTWTNMFVNPEKGKQLMQDFIEKYSDVKPDIKIILCGYEYPEDNQNLIHIAIPWAEKISWYTHWFGRMVTSDLQLTDPGVFHEPPNKLYSCFLNRGHKYHRMGLMLSLLDNNMMDLGEVRFCNDDIEWKFFMDMVKADEELKKQEDWNRTDKPGKWKHIPEHFLPHKTLYQEIQPYLDDLKSVYHWTDNDSIFDPAYHDCMIDIVAMSDTHHITFDEKVARPLLFGKPFYNIGPPNCNVKLQDLGFELYTELFDYTNDNHFTDTHLREPRKNEWVQGRREYYNQSLKPIYDMDGSPECIREIFDITRQKALYNQRRFIEIVFDDSFIPDILPKNMRNQDYEVAVTWPRQRLRDHDYFSKLI